MTFEEDFWAKLVQIQAESIGWIPLDEGAYLHVGSDEAVIQVVGLDKEEMAGSNVCVFSNELQGLNQPQEAATGFATTHLNLSL